MPELPRLSYPGQMLYLFLLSIPMAIVSVYISYADTILYPMYASAPRIWGISPMNDQMIGGLIMWIPGGLFFYTIISIVFFRWQQRNGEESQAAAQVDWRACSEGRMGTSVIPSEARDLGGCAVNRLARGWFRRPMPRSLADARDDTVVVPRIYSLDGTCEHDIQADLDEASRRPPSAAARRGKRAERTSPVPRRFPRADHRRHAPGQQSGNVGRDLSTARARHVERLDANGPHLPVLSLHRRRHDPSLAHGAARSRRR